MKRTTSVIVAALALVAFFPAVPAQAAGTLTRTFVSSTGVDSNPCTIAQPCATFATAYNAVAANGIVAALDPGKYGPLTITGPVTINGNGWAAITGTAQGSGITVNASSGSVVLTGLEIDGAGAADNGIDFTGGGTLHLENSAIRNFTTSGIDFAPSTSSQLHVSSTLVSDNAGTAFVINSTGSASVTAVLDRVELDNSFNGLFVSGGNSGTFNVTIADSVVANNSQFGITSTTGGAATSITVRNSVVSDNGAGFSPGVLTTIRVAKSTITGNTTGFSTSLGGTLDSYGDNNLDGNGTDGTSTSVIGLH